MAGADDLPRSPSPSLAPNEFIEMLRDADTLLALMGSESLPVVADLADEVTARANRAGASELANAAWAVNRIASGHQGGVALAGAMWDLTRAMTQAQGDYHLQAG
jgi:hypothetical protein